jgi:glycine/D-amino acid oxidase-like deaminating enzyme
VVLERAQIASGATQHSAGILAPEPHVWSDPRSLVELGRESLRLTRALDVEWDGAPGLSNLDCLIAGLQLGDAPMAIEAHVEVLRGPKLHERESELVGVEEALLIHDQARVNPVRFSLALAAHAGCVATGIDVRRIGRRGDRVTTLFTSHGDIHPGVVVFATGIAPARYVTIQHAFMKGHLIATAPVEFRLQSQISTPFGGAFQLDDGRLVSGGTLDTGDGSAKVRQEVVETIRRGIETVLPRAAGVPVTHAWYGFRPHTLDRLPIIDKIPGLANAWVTSGHYRTGILMAAATGAALAEWIVSGSQPSNVSAFSLRRFGTSAA